VLGAESGSWMALELLSGAAWGRVVCPGVGTRTGAGPHAVTNDAMAMTKTNRLGFFNDALLVPWRRLIGTRRVADGLRRMSRRRTAAHGSYSGLSDERGDRPSHDPGVDCGSACF
jgi:hypothetical protein